MVTLFLFVENLHHLVLHTHKVLDLHHGAPFQSVHLQTQIMS